MSKELELVNELINGIEKYEKETGRKNPPAYISKESLISIKERLETIDNAKPNEALENLRCLVNVSYDTDNIDEEQYEEYLKDYNTIKQYILKSQEQEKENEVLKEIIKSFFYRGCPLNQYIDKDFGLTIEVDSECSIMHLGKYKGIDLDKKLKEVLKEVLE